MSRSQGFVTRRKVVKYLAAVFVGIIIGAVACCGRSIY